MLNTDWGDGGHRNFLAASLHGLAHGAAHSWNGAAVEDKTFTRRFCRQVFNRADDDLAEMLGTLGTTYLTCCAKGRTDYHGRRFLAETRWARDAGIVSMYRALVEPLACRQDSADGSIGRAVEYGVRAVLERLEGPRGRPAARPGLDEFMSAAFDKLLMAARMEALACRRTLTAKAMRAGRWVSPAEFRALASQTAEVADGFRRLWLVRNKPSRLRENLLLLARARREARRLAGGA